MQSGVKNPWLFFIAGISFAVLWGSGSTVTKLGMQYLQPWVLAVCRLFFAAFIMLIMAHVILGYSLPQRKHWKSILVYGLLNLGIFLGLYMYGLQFVWGGLGTLMTGTTPLFITLFTGLWLKKKISPLVIFSLLLCVAGVLTAASPMIQFNRGSEFGMLLLLAGIISNAAGAVYFVGRNWEGINLLTINAWQTLMGALFLLPLCVYHYDSSLNHFTWQAVASIGWLAIFLSVTAILLWLFILRQNPLRAAFWYFLCPVVGFGLAAVLLHEPFTWYTVVGILLVITGLYLGQRNA